MLKENGLRLRRFLLAVDLAVTVGSFGLACSLLGPPSPVLPLTLGFFGAVLVLWVVLLHAARGYESFRTASVGSVATGVLKAVGSGTALLASLLFFAGLHEGTVAFPAVFGAINLLALLLERLLLLTLLRAVWSRNYRNVLVVGTGRRASDLGRRIEAHPEWGLRIQGYLDREPALLDHPVNGHRVIGVLDDLPRILNQRVIDEVLFVVPRSWLGALDGAVRLCEEQGVRCSLALDLFEAAVARPILSELGEFPLLTYSTTPYPAGKLALKRAVDLAGATALLLLLSPLLLGIVAAIRLTSPGPVLFRQKRVGLHGRRFTLLKFRSMMTNAEERLHEVAHLNEMSGPVFKATNDPRVTGVGRILRRASLDELPQLINVLKGEMSLVGPRPPVPSEVEHYQRWQRRRLSVKPGITCLWQVNGRNRIDFEDWMKLDLQYIDNWSLGLDLKILGKTVPAVLFGNGAS